MHQFITLRQIDSRYNETSKTSSLPSLVSIPSILILIFHFSQSRRWRHNSRHSRADRCRLTRSHLHLLRLFLQKLHLDHHWNHLASLHLPLPMPHILHRRIDRPSMRGDTNDRPNLGVRDNAV